MSARYRRSDDPAPRPHRDAEPMTVTFRVLTVSGEEGAELRTAQAEAMRTFLLWVQSQRSSDPGARAQRDSA